VALLTADLVSALGNWVSVIVLPWLVLQNTGSPVKMGLVAAAELVPYLLSSVFGPPVADRVGLRRASILTDVGSALAMASIAVVPRIGYLPLLVLAGVAGGLRGVGDRTKHVLLAPVATTAGVPMIRVTSLYETLTRGMQLIGAPLGGLLIVWLGTQQAIWVDATSFLACAALVGFLVFPDAEGAEPVAREPYLVALRGGVVQLWRDRLLFAMILSVFTINVLSQAATSVLVPLWVADVLHSAAGLGLVLSSYAAGAVLGSLAFTAMGPKLPQFLMLAVGLTIGGAPRLFVLGGSGLVVVLVVTFVSGVGVGVVNPIFGAMLYARVPADLQTRVFGLVGAACYAGLPIGAALAGWAVTALDLRTSVIVGGLLYIAVSVLPIRQLLRAGRAEQMISHPV
jgi:MFS family permease